MTGKRRHVTTSHEVVASAAKRRRTDGPKFYAVRAGIRPGVYDTWDECQQQTAGFRGAIYKSFPSFDDAQAFVEGHDPPSADEPPKFYGVAVGNPTGVYLSWTEVTKAITGVKGPKYKKFPTRRDAEVFVREYSDRQRKKDPTAARTTAPDGGKTAAAAGTLAAPAAVAITKPGRDKSGAAVLVIYTDGSSLSNGRKGAAAGLGVFFGLNDPRNVSERVPGEPQTNQRAELYAIYRALQISGLRQSVCIRTDSKYSIDCLTNWAMAWRKKGWKTTEGTDVKNRDVIEPLRDLMDRREQAGVETHLEWVKGHASDPGNITADFLAVRGAKLPPVSAGEAARKGAGGGAQQQQQEEENEDDEEEEADLNVGFEVASEGDGEQTSEEE